MIKFVIQSLATLTLLGQILLVGLIIVAILTFIFKKKVSFTKFVSENGYFGVFVITLIATLGSLFFSEVAKFTPCVLCWYQRILMYPQPLLLYVGILRKEFVLKYYLLVLNALGLGIAIYHYILQIEPKLLISPCVAGDVSCVKGYTFYFGYISIPLMSATAFALNLLLLSLTKPKKRYA